MNENFEALFEESKYSKEFKKGQIVQADVIDITSDHAILNSGLKSESAVSIHQFKNTDGEIEIKVGDIVDVSLEDIEDGEGQTKLSRQRAKNETTWKEIMKALEENSIINGLGKSYGQEVLTFYKMKKKMGPPDKHTYKFSNKYDNSWKLELEDFYMDIIKKKSSTPSIFDAYENLKIINNIYRKKNVNN